MTAPDAALEAQHIRLAAAGDRRAFAWLVRAHQGYLRKLLTRACHGDQGRADDMAQEAFLKAWRALPGFRGEARFRTWLTRLAWSAMAAERHALPVHEGDSPANESSVSDFSPGSDRRLDMDRALAALKENERQALLLCFGADLSHAEAAQVLGWPLGTLKTQVLRARQKMRAMLKDWETP